jgi:hypothetical protein
MDLAGAVTTQKRQETKENKKAMSRQPSLNRAEAI